ncbi:MAG: DUF354 domain-containing protein [Natrialbaceae archaeon]|nr:DUF354 domain-containing protein [Natrialbaceae archaeon]
MGVSAALQCDGTPLAETMRTLFLVNTPAHAHLYRYPIQALQDRGHSVLALARDHGCTTSLLDWFELPYECYGSHESTGNPVSMARSILGQFVSIISRSRSFDPAVVFGRGQYAALAGTVTGAPTVLVLDDEPSSLNHTISKPFADLILSPAATRRTLGRRHYTFDGFTESAYLHPSVFSPAASVRSALGLGPDERFVLLRFNAHEALHDRGLRGFSRPQRARLIETLAEEARVIVSDESESVDLSGLPATRFDAHPARIHDAIAAASLVVADTGTIVIEGALIGTPTIRYRGTDRREYGEFESLTEAGILEEYDRFQPLLDRSRAILADPSCGKRWKDRRDTIVAGQPDVTGLIVTVAENRGLLPPAHPDTTPAVLRASTN